MIFSRWLRKTPLSELPGRKTSCLPLRQVSTGVMSGPLTLAWPDLISKGPVVVIRSVRNASFINFLNIASILPYLKMSSIYASRKAGPSTWSEKVFLSRKSRMR